MNTSKTRRLVAAAAAGGLYAALTLALAPISYGPIQFRVSEILCILPFFLPVSAGGLTVGCILANLLGPGLGWMDVVFGSLATLLASLCTAAIGMRARRLGDVGWGPCLLACLMPVLFNAPMIGFVIAYAVKAEGVEASIWSMTALFGAQVGFGEAIVMFVLGLPAMRYLLKNPRLAEEMGRLR